VVGDGLVRQAVSLAEDLRAQLPGLSLQLNCGGGKYNSQIKKAFNSGARIAIVLEQERGETGPVRGVKLRPLDDSPDSEVVMLEDLPGRLQECLTL
jgi:histidyl-tRNA synthetase